MKLHFHIFNILSALLPGRMTSVRRRLALLANFNIGEGVQLMNSVSLSGSHISIASNTWLSPYVKIYGNERGLVNIGSNCDIGHHTKIVTGTHELGTQDRRAGKNMSLPVSIGDGTWIGANCLILGGANVGAGSVVAAGAVVIKGDYPSNFLLAGVPAKPVKQLEDSK